MTSMTAAQDGYKRNTFSIGITVALTSWTMVFITLLWGYVVMRMRVGVWLTPYISADIMTAAVLNTAALALSSYLIRKEKLFMGIMMGLIFLSGQLCVFKLALNQGLHWQGNMAGGFFYLLCGFHALHIVGGMAALIVLWMRYAALKGTAAALGIRYFWDFLMIIWLVMFALMFVVR